MNMLMLNTGNYSKTVMPQITSFQDGQPTSKKVGLI